MLTIRKGKVVKQSRIAPERNDDADHFCQVFGELVTSFPVSEATLHNLDGIRLAMDRDRTMRTSAVAANDRLGDNVTLTVDTTTLIAIPIVSAAGECLAVYIIVQNPGSSSSGAASSEEGAERGGDEVELDVVLDVPPIGRVTRSSRRSWNYYSLTATTGYLDSATFYNILKHWAGCGRRLIQEFILTS